ncbi:MAG: proline iminopeptidase-family hydrolase [Pseudomonadota bacterium]
MSKIDWRFSQEGLVKVQGGRIWFGIAGDMRSANDPLLVIHGGPGMSHDYLYPLTDLSLERAVIFYDQLDAGRSDRPNNPENWNLERFLGEIDVLRDHLGLEDLCLFGNSWGGTLAAAYGAGQSGGVKKLVLSSPLLNTDQWLSDNALYRNALPANLRQVMEECESNGMTDSPAYIDAVEVFYRRHLCRTDPWPGYVIDTFDKLNETCYAGMWGPNEFTCTGILSGYDGTSELKKIKAPTLITCGQFDEATPATCQSYAEIIPNSKVLVFEDSSHFAFVEQRSIFKKEVEDFLST